jgi:hypothetical protein
VKVIYKYGLNAWSARQTISMYEGEIMHVGEQNGMLQMWLRCVHGSPTVMREFQVVGTGIVFDDTGHRHIGTVQIDAYVWHVFEVHDE